MHSTTHIYRDALILPRWPIVVALALLLCSLLLFWPGIAGYDTLTQYQQILAQSYDDWHPPIMARLWSVLLLLDHGSGPMLALQFTGYWVGIGLLAQPMARGKAAALLALGASPLFVGWVALVLKDSQMIGALSLASGCIGHYRLRNRPITLPALIIACLCLAYATLVRANGAFSTVPLAVLLLPTPLKPLTRLAAIAAGIFAILLLSQPINQRLLGAQDSGVRRSEPIYDLAAIAVRTGERPAGLDPQAARALTTHDCVKPLFWDRLGEVPACASVVRPWTKAPVGWLYGQLARAALAHPVAYVSHRMAHLNSTERWIVPLHWPLAAPPAEAEPNDLGFPNPSVVAAHWQKLAGWVAETPLGWPVIWLALALWGIGIASTRASANDRTLALALLASALVQEASFAVISISSDLRYHLWPMFATALAWVILWRPGMAGVRYRPALAALGFLLLSGTIARLTLPTPPTCYADLMK
ncbi:hypothetical protein [Sphingobium mellinum]|uniref:hypothetical protein n=1 Tax=Sphingobium mellinum TaxID=1387166 RepID=UPI0030ED9DBD